MIEPPDQVVIFLAEKERLSRNAKRSVALLQLRLLPSLTLRISLDKNQVAATRTRPLYPPPAACASFPSHAFRRSRSNLSANKKGHRVVSF